MNQTEKFFEQNKNRGNKTTADFWTAREIIKMLFGDEIFLNSRNCDGRYMIYDFADGWISDLKDRYEINFLNGKTYNLWILK